jgi:hypothetical protein
MIENTAHELDNIKDALEKFYVQGHALYDPGLYMEILHPSWKMFHLIDGVLEKVDREEFCRWYEPQNRDPELEWESEILDIDLTGEVAHAKLRLENQRVCYLDYLNLMKIDNKWWIVHKIYHQEDKI